MKGLKRPVYVDNSVLDMIQYEFVENMNMLYGERNMIQYESVENMNRLYGKRTNGNKTTTP